MTDKEGTTEARDGAIEAPEPVEPGREALTEQLRARDVTIASLEQVVAGKDSQVAALKQAESETGKKLVDLGNSLARAVERYKALVIRSNPAVPAELITGNTVEGLDESLKSAQLIIDRVRQEVEAEASRTRVPAGAPPRSPLDLSGLSPREKIQYAIGGKK